MFANPTVSHPVFLPYKVQDNLVKMYQNGQIDAMTAMKMLAESTANKAPKTPVASAPSVAMPPKKTVEVPTVGQKRPHSHEPTEVDSESDLEGEEFNHLDPWVGSVACMFRVLGFGGAFAICLQNWNLMSPCCPWFIPFLLATPSIDQG